MIARESVNWGDCVNDVHNQKLDLESGDHIVCEDCGSRWTKKQFKRWCDEYY